MSTSTNGQLYYGVIFEEGALFPWDDEDNDESKYQGDQEGWWRDIVLGFKPSFCPWTDTGAYKEGVDKDDPRINVYFNEMKAFDKEKGQFPFELVNYCSGDYPMYMLALKDGYSNSRGYLTEIKPEEMTVDEEKKKELMDFCEKYELEFTEGPGWFLSSYWG